MADGAGDADDGEGGSVVAEGHADGEEGGGGGWAEVWFREESESGRAAAVEEVGAVVRNGGGLHCRERGRERQREG